MERLTEIDEGAIVFCDNNAHHLYRPEDMSPAQTKEILERLFVYENIGSPVAFAELAKVKTEGGWWKLPCNVGDFIYIVPDGTSDIAEVSVTSIMILEKDIKIYWLIGYTFARNIGKTFFLSYAEAEAALREGRVINV
jgi:hypothetical protein